jgi:hypothetical protein
MNWELLSVYKRCRQRASGLNQANRESYDSYPSSQSPHVQGDTQPHYEAVCTHNLC